MSAPCGQFDHQTNDPWIQPLVRVWPITVFIECQLTQEQITPLHRGGLGAGVKSQSQSSHLQLVGKNAVRHSREGKNAAKMLQEDWSRHSPGSEEQAAWLALCAQLCQTSHS